MNAILIVGGCGSGKTWVMKSIIKKLKIEERGKIGMFYYHKNENVVVLGKYDGSTFEGSDRLSMAIMRDLPKFKVAIGSRLVICEGDRFMNSTFLNSVCPVIIRIKDNGEKGRKLRGSSQTARQIQSVATRVAKVVPNHDVLDSNEALKVVLSYI